jgi:hypothetical protein
MPASLGTSNSCGYGDIRAVNMSFDDAVSRIEGALKTEGFGILCAIDIQSKMKEKVGIDFPRYIILGHAIPSRVTGAQGGHQPWASLTVQCGGLRTRRASSSWRGRRSEDAFSGGSPGIRSAGAPDK